MKLSGVLDSSHVNSSIRTRLEHFFKVRPTRLKENIEKSIIINLTTPPIDNIQNVRYCRRCEALQLNVKRFVPVRAFHFRTINQECAKNMWQVNSRSPCGVRHYSNVERLAAVYFHGSINFSRGTQLKYFFLIIIAKKQKKPRKIRNLYIIITCYY